MVACKELPFDPRCDTCIQAEKEVLVTSDSVLARVMKAVRLESWWSRQWQYLQIAMPVILARSDSFANSKHILADCGEERLGSLDLVHDLTKCMAGVTAISAFLHPSSVESWTVSSKEHTVKHASKVLEDPNESSTMTDVGKFFAIGHRLVWTHRPRTSVTVHSCRLWVQRSASKRPIRPPSG